MNVVSDHLATEGPSLVLNLLNTGQRPSQPPVKHSLIQKHETGTTNDLKPGKHKLTDTTHDEHVSCYRVFGVH